MSCHGLKALLSFWSLVVAILLPASVSCLAQTVALDEAERAASAWLARSQSFMGLEGRRIVRELRAAGGGDRGTRGLYVARLEPEGFLLLSADRSLPPVLGFSPTGEWIEQEESPPTAFFLLDARRRLDAADEHVRSDATATANAARWKSLLAVAERASLSVLTDDPRVLLSPDVQWGQGYIYTAAGQKKACYNHYCPPGPVGNANNYPAGCIPVVIAHFARFHKHGTAPVGAQRVITWTDGSDVEHSETRTFKGGSGSGGAYDWDKMPLSVDYNTPDDEILEIAALMHDGGLAVPVHYDSGGTWGLEISDPLVLDFGFANAITSSAPWTQAHFTASEFQRMANANLDAGYPVALSLTGPQGAHAVICDGYGFHDGIVYHHLNMGWSNRDDVWYALPVVSTSSTTFTNVTECVYNVFPHDTGEVVSGRVLDVNGKPVVDAIVTASVAGRDGVETRSDTRGIWAFVGLPSSSEVTVAVASDGWSEAPETVSLGTSAGWDACGNRWGVDLIVDAVGVPQVIRHIQESGLSEREVQLSVLPPAGTGAVTVTENIPAGLAPTDISHSGVWDPGGRIITWGDFADDVNRLLTYTISGTTGIYILSGQGLFDGKAFSTRGDWQVALASEWLTNRQAAMDLASASGRLVYLLTGEGDYYYTTHMRDIVCADSEVSALLDRYYVRWFSDMDTSTAYRTYDDGLGTYFPPISCVIDPVTPNSYLARTTSEQTSAAMVAFLSGPLDLHGLVVVDGSGSGRYNAGESVAVAANPWGADASFDEWTGDTSGLADSSAAVTRFTMPSADAVLTATYGAAKVTVTFQPGAHGSLTGANEDGNVVVEVAFDSAFPAPPAIVPDAGYGYEGWDLEMPDTVKFDITITAEYSLGWEITLALTSDDGSGSLVFGMRPGASDSFDGALDEVLPGGQQPAGCRLVLDATACRKDYRFGDSASDWILELTPPVPGAREAPASLTVTWDATGMLADGQYLTLHELDGADMPLGYSSRNMALTTMLEIAPSSARALRRFLIRYSESLEVAIPFVPGWNLVSLPFSPLDSDPLQLLGVDAGSGQVWERVDGMAQEAVALVALAGYWVYARSSRNEVLQGVSIPPAARALRAADWDAVGVDRRTANPLEAYRLWDPETRSFLVPLELVPGRGYWLDRSEVRR